MPAAANRIMKAAPPYFSLVPAAPVRVRPFGVDNDFYRFGDCAVADAFEAASLRPICLKRITITWRRLSASDLRERLNRCSRESWACRRACVIGYLADLCGKIGPRHIEVIDAQRQALDAETELAVAEDAARQARVELLVASGRFPSE
jgi:hypothetical protein